MITWASQEAILHSMMQKKQICTYQNFRNKLEKILNLLEICFMNNFTI